MAFERCKIFHKCHFINLFDCFWCFLHICMLNLQKVRAVLLYFLVKQALRLRSLPAAAPSNAIRASSAAAPSRSAPNGSDTSFDTACESPVNNSTLTKVYRSNEWVKAKASFVFSGLLTATRKTAVLCPRQRCLWLVRRLWLTEGWTYPVTLWISLTNPSVRFRTRKTKRRWRPKTTLRSKTKAVEKHVSRECHEFCCFVRLFIVCFVAEQHRLLLEYLV